MMFFLFLVFLLFRSKQRTKKVLLNMIRGFEVRRKVGLIFSTPNDSMKDK